MTYDADNMRVPTQPGPWTARTYSFGKYFIAVAASSLFWWAVYFGGRAGVIPSFPLLLFYVPLGFAGNLLLGFVGISSHELDTETEQAIVSYLSQLPILIMLSLISVAIYNSFKEEFPR